MIAYEIRNAFTIYHLQLTIINVLPTNCLPNQFLHQ